jgi:phospholipase/carboxylesterase
LKVEHRTLNLLPAVIYHPLQPSRVHQWTLIYLHGLGSSAFGNYPDLPHLFLDGTIALKVIIPTAPSRELSIFDEWWYKTKQSKSADGSPAKPRWRITQFLSWYDYLTNHDGKREDKIDQDSLRIMQKALHQLIRDEADQLNGRFDRVIMGGKSQGCCTALDAALTFPERLGGFIGCVGHLLSCTPTMRAGPQAETPLHFYHEVEDEIMQWAWVQQGERRLKEAGHDVRSRHNRDPEGNGHFIGGIEGRWIRQALQSICNTGK